MPMYFNHYSIILLYYYTIILRKTLDVCRQSSIIITIDYASYTAGTIHYNTQTTTTHNIKYLLLSFLMMR